MLVSGVADEDVLAVDQARAQQVSVDQSNHRNLTLDRAAEHPLLFAEARARVGAGELEQLGAERLEQLVLVDASLEAQPALVDQRVGAVELVDHAPELARHLLYGSAEVEEAIGIELGGESLGDLDALFVVVDPQHDPAVPLVDEQALALQPPELAGVIEQDLDAGDRRDGGDRLGVGQLADSVKAELHEGRHRKRDLTELCAGNTGRGVRVGAAMHTAAIPEARTILAAAWIALLSTITLGGCAGDSTGGSATQSQAIPEPARVASIEVEHRPDLAAPLLAAGYSGVFVLLDPATQTLIVSDPELAERGFIPASTFKIPNSLIALETGVADGPGFVLKWDGVDRWAADWNRDHDLRSAFRVSAVWYYQEIARRIGEQRMAEWVTAADYGNEHISGGIDLFWLNGGLRISPREQVEFLRRVHEGASPFSPTTVAVFLDEVMTEEQRDGLTIRAKTGWGRSQDFADPAAAGFEGHVGWYVGSVEEQDGSRVYFATLLLTPDPAPESFYGDRRELTRALLRALGHG